MNKYYIGQLLKNSPNDNEPFFKIIKIDELNGNYYYRVQCLYDDEMILVLHSSDLFPYIETECKHKENKTIPIAGTMETITICVECGDEL